MPVVTMSGTWGSGAREVGQLVAEILGIDYVDQEIMVDAARRLGVSAESLAGREERCLSFRERLAKMLGNFLERSAVAGVGDPLMGSGGLEVLLARSYADLGAEPRTTAQELDDALYVKTVRVIISELSQKGNIVILGHGGQMILRDLPHALHVLALAPLKLRIERFAEREQIALEEAGKRIHDLDRGRAAFHRKFFKVEVNDPALYDLVIDTGRLPYPVAAEVVAVAARAKEAGLPK